MNAGDCECCDCYACGFEIKCVGPEITNKSLKLDLIVSIRISLHGREINCVVLKSVHVVSKCTRDPKISTPDPSQQTENTFS